MQRDSDLRKVPEAMKALDIKKETESESMIGTRNYGRGVIRRLRNLIMLIEDNLDHAEIIMRTIQTHPIPNEVRHFPDGQSALDYLFRRNSYSDPVSSPRPQVVLLDMQLPDVDAIEILRVIKSSDELRTLPVVVLTTSASERDITQAYCNHANSYLVKPVGCEEFKALMDTLCLYWLGNNISPTR